MISLLGLLAALVALLTGFAMLHDTHITRDDLAELRAILGRIRQALRVYGLAGLDLRELQAPTRGALRILVLIAIVASSGIAALEAALLHRALDPIEVLLRVALAAHLAMQAPCPWITWITHGDLRQAPRQAQPERRGGHVY